MTARPFAGRRIGRRTIAGGALALVAAVMAPGVLSGCGSDDPVEVASPQLQELDADQVMIGVEHYMTSEGVRRAHLVADTALFFNDESRIRFRTLQVDFFDENGAVSSVLTADRGVFNTRTEDMTAEGDVVVVDQVQDRRLETERLIYDAAADSLRSESEFVYYQGPNITRGQGFVSDPGLDNIEVLQPSGRAPNVELPD